MGKNKAKIPFSLHKADPTTIINNKVWFTGLELDKEIEECYRKKVNFSGGTYYLDSSGDIEEGYLDIMQARKEAGFYSDDKDDSLFLRKPFIDSLPVENPFNIAIKQYLVDPSYPPCDGANGKCGYNPYKFILDNKLHKIICPICGTIHSEYITPSKVPANATAYIIPKTTKSFLSSEIDIVEELNNLQITYEKGKPRILHVKATEKFT